jgi:outer membrane protein assembly factor BamB
VFVTCGHSAGGRLLKINPDQRGVTQVWHREEFDNCHGGVILLAGRLYGCGCRLGGKDFFCVDFLTGETKWTSSALGKVSITYADGMFYCLSDKGRMSLAAVTPTGLSVVSQFDLPKQTDLSLCHPVVCGGRLYVRHDKNLYVYDVRQDPQSK